MGNVDIPRRVTFKSRNLTGGTLTKMAMQVLGARNVLDDPGLATYQLADGTLLEIYGPQLFDTEQLFRKGSQVASFRVADLQEAVNKMIAAGAVTLDGIVRPHSCYAFCYFSIDDEQIIGLYEMC